MNFICHEFPSFAILCILLQRRYGGVEFRAIHPGYKIFDFYQQISIDGIDCYKTGFFITTPLFIQSLSDVIQLSPEPGFKSPYTQQVFEPQSLPLQP